MNLIGRPVTATIERAAPPDRPGERPAGQRSEPTPPPVHGNAEDDEKGRFSEDDFVVSLTFNVISAIF